MRSYLASIRWRKNVIVPLEVLVFTASQFENLSSVPLAWWLDKEKAVK
jgi:hypothetical protein